MPWSRTSLTQSSCSISIIDTVSSIDTTVFVETPPGDAPWFGCRVYSTHRRLLGSLMTRGRFHLLVQAHGFDEDF